MMRDITKHLVPPIEMLANTSYAI